MPLIVYLDETGDHTLEVVDRTFPLFAVVMFICDTTEYVRRIMPAVCAFKFRYFGHETIVLHSRDIRKAAGPFSILLNRTCRDTFLQEIQQIMSDMDYTLITTVIRKQAHKDRYGEAANNPYDLALKYSLERLLPLLETHNQTEVKLIAESRGRREDKDLKLAFLQTIQWGTWYIPAERFRAIRFDLQFMSKGMNTIGTQLADLAGYPICRHVLDPDRANPPFEALKSKFYHGPGRVNGLKIFP